MIIKGTEIFTDGHFTKADIKISAGKIVMIGSAIVPSEGEEVLECPGNKIVPGLIDIHTHGRMGYDFTTAGEDEIHRLLENYLKAGVTGVLATVMTNEKAVMLGACERIAKIINEQRTGYEKGGSDRKEATVLGINFEGVWLSANKRGAHLEKYLRLPSLQQFDELEEAADGNIRLVTIAPELEGAAELISGRKDRAHFSLGHSEATFEEACRAIEAGADHATHLFNAMPVLGHRAPGLAGAALDRGLFTEMICDGLHVHPMLIRMSFAANGDKIVLISDSIAPAGLENGVYISGDQPVTAKDGRIFTREGTLAGSGITLFEGLKRCV